MWKDRNVPYELHFVVELTEAKIQVGNWETHYSLLCTYACKSTYLNVLNYSMNFVLDVKNFSHILLLLTKFKIDKTFKYLLACLSEYELNNISSSFY